MSAIVDPFAKAPKSLIAAVDGTTLRVLLMLATHADFTTGRDAYPSVETLAKELGCKPTAVKRALTIGVRKGLLHRRPRFREDGGKTSSYYDCLWVAGPPSRNSGDTLAAEATEPQSSKRLQSEPVDRHPSDRSSTHAPSCADVYESDCTKKQWTEWRQRAQTIVDFWNKQCPDQKKASLPAKRIPWAIHTAWDRWTAQELGTIICNVRDSTYCAGTDHGGRVANLLWAMTPEYGDKLLAGQYDDG